MRGRPARESCGAHEGWLHDRAGVCNWRELRAGLPTSELPACMLTGQPVDKLPFNRHEGISSRDRR